MESSVGLKFDQDKPRYDLLDTYAIDQLAQVLTFGAKKYAAHNWRKGITTSRLIAAAFRHLFTYLGEQDKDQETGLSHVAHAMCCCMFLLGLESKKEFDDRYQEVSNDSPQPPLGILAYGSDRDSLHQPSEFALVLSNGV